MQLNERLQSAWAVLIGKEQKPVPETLGTVDSQLQIMLGQWAETFAISNERQSRYMDFSLMDDSYLGAMLDVITHATLGFDGNDTAADILSSNDAFKIEIDGYGTSAPKREIARILEDTKLKDWMYAMARSVLKWGDLFIEPLVADNELQGIWTHRAPEIVVRRDSKGRLEKGTDLVGQSQVPLAYRQIDGMGRVVTGWYPNEIVHAKFWPTMDSAYSERSFLDLYRKSWRRMDIVEQSMVVARCVRAYLRLVYYIDMSGKSPQDARKSLREFIQASTTKLTPSGVAERSQLQVDENLYLTTGYQAGADGKSVPKLTKVEAIDPSGAGFSADADIRIFQKQLFSQIPADALGVQDRSTNDLTAQDVSEAALLRYVQRQVLEKQIIRPIIDLGLRLKGMKAAYKVVFAQPVNAGSWKNADAQFRLALGFRTEWEAAVSSRKSYLKRVRGYSDDEVEAELAQVEAELKRFGLPNKGDTTGLVAKGSQSAGLELDNDTIAELA